MAGPAAAVSEAWGKVTGFLHSQINDKENRANNYKIAKALGLFAGSILLMRNCGDIMAV
ncbi:unnamed protein product [Urochloa decumbens]|uniref:Uncharacterized protein n=1 Tax=Urochloa decumbens TaxID=240449 RepID=A0ABC8VXA1_9POAL